MSADCYVETTRRVVDNSGKRLAEVTATSGTEVVTIAAGGVMLLQLSDVHARALAEALLDAASEAA